MIELDDHDITINLLIYKLLKKKEKYILSLNK